MIITATIAVPVGSTASGITDALTTALGGSTSAATFFLRDLGIVVESVPTFKTTDNNRDTGNSLALPLGLGLGLGLGGCLVLFALFMLMRKGKRVHPKA